METTIPKIKSTTGILDVTVGRKKLAKLMPEGSQRLPKKKLIPVTIRGFISHQHGTDDGTSIEFGIDVKELVVGEPGV